MCNGCYDVVQILNLKRKKRFKKLSTVHLSVLKQNLRIFSVILITDCYMFYITHLAFVYLAYFVCQ